MTITCRERQKTAARRLSALAGHGTAELATAGVTPAISSSLRFHTYTGAYSGQRGGPRALAQRACEDVLPADATSATGSARPPTAPGEAWRGSRSSIEVQPIGDRRLPRRPALCSATSMQLAFQAEVARPWQRCRGGGVRGCEIAPGRAVRPATALLGFPSRPRPWSWSPGLRPFTQATSARPVEVCRRVWHRPTSCPATACASRSPASTTAAPSQPPADPSPGGPPW